ncbi:hypothetical protein K0M31_012595 [Melipona bicolor]|uniref:Uncharacterized protein n=1 Tax=Melipona bicolor TaxID=60889 RepID=A0AA40KH81_9HYME|nr:hypothetical protein K0M31_012595 [Melipona bicolor]
MPEKDAHYIKSADYTASTSHIPDKIETTNGSNNRKLQTVCYNYIRYFAEDDKRPRVQGANCNFWGFSEFRGHNSHKTRKRMQMVIIWILIQITGLQVVLQSVEVKSYFVIKYKRSFSPNTDCLLITLMIHIEPTCRQCLFSKVKDLYWLMDSLPRGVCKAMSVHTVCEKVIIVSISLRRLRSLQARCRGSGQLDDYEDSQVEDQACDVFLITGITEKDSTVSGVTLVLTEARFRRKTGRERRKRHDTSSFDDMEMEFHGKEGTVRHSYALAKDRSQEDWRKLTPLTARSILHCSRREENRSPAMRRELN